MMHQPFQQGAACHYLACAYFHENNRAHGGEEREAHAVRRGRVPERCGPTRDSAGPKHPKAIKEAIGSLLFLARVLSELKDWGNAERVHMQALEIARDSLGDGAEETKQCLQSLMGLKQRIKQAET